jgi:serine/threonine protein phosphatase PrpC
MFDIAATTWAGLVRHGNEDCASVNGNRVLEGHVFRDNIEGGAFLAFVADGMGGHARGEIASSTVLDELELNVGRILDPHGIVPAIRIANRAVYEIASSNPAYRGMGSTLVGVVVDKTTCTCFNVGDSRAYHCRHGRLKQLSTDHVPAAASGQTRSHAISQSLGGAPYFREVMPSVASVDLLPGDRILLCSDGLTDVLRDVEIEPVISSGAPEECVAKLLDHVLSKGAPDNVTIVLIVVV